MGFQGLENSEQEIGKDESRYVGLDMTKPGMKLCVNIIAAGRPNYTYVCLDSIFRNSVFAPDSRNIPDVYLYVDKLANGDDYSAEMLQVASHFPVRGVFINDKHQGGVANHWSAFDNAFNSGYDFAIVMENDWLITTNALQWLYDIPKVAFHYSVYRWTDRMEPGREIYDNPKKPDGSLYERHCYDLENFTLFKDGMYLSWCLGFEPAAYEFMKRIIDAKGTFGLHGRNLTRYEMERNTHIDWDRLVNPILKHYGLLSMCPLKSYLAHFGSKTSIYMGFGSRMNRHKEMFEGDKSQWLDNVIKLFNSTTDEEKENLRFRPLTFEYC